MTKHTQCENRLRSYLCKKGGFNNIDTMQEVKKDDKITFMIRKKDNFYGELSVTKGTRLKNSAPLHTREVFVITHSIEIEK